MIVKVLVAFVALLVASCDDDLVRAQGDLGHAEPDRPEPGRAVRDRCRRWPTGSSCSSRRTCCPTAPTPSSSSWRPTSPSSRPFLIFAVVPVGGIITIGGHTFELQVADPPMGILFVLAMSAIARLRRHAGRLVVGLEVPAARLGAGLGADDLLRGRARHDRGHGGARHRLALHPGHRGRAGRAASGSGTLIRLGFVPFIFFIDRHHGRDEPAALRPGRGRAGAGRRLPHRVLLDPVRACSSWPSS